MSSILPGYLKFLASTRATIIARSGTERKHPRTGQNLGEAPGARPAGLAQWCVTGYRVLDDVIALKKALVSIFLLVLFFGLVL